MPQVHFVKKARKAIKSAGIKKGDSYYYWAFFRGTKQVSKTHPRASQLTQTAMATAYSGMEQVEDVITEINQLDTDNLLNTAYPEEMLAEALRSGADDVRQAAEEYIEQQSNIEDGFGHSTEKSDEAGEKSDNLNQAADDMESAADEIEELAYHELEFISPPDDTNWLQLMIEKAQEALNGVENAG